MRTGFYVKQSVTSDVGQLWGEWAVQSPESHECGKRAVRRWNVKNDHHVVTWRTVTHNVSTLS